MKDYIKVILLFLGVFLLAGIIAYPFNDEARAERKAEREAEIEAAYEEGYADAEKDNSSDNEYAHGYYDALLDANKSVEADLHDLLENKPYPQDDIEFIYYYFLEGGDEEYSFDDAEQAINNLSVFMENLSNYYSNIKLFGIQVDSDVLSK